MNGWSVREAGPMLVVPTATSSLRAQLVFPQFTDSTLTPAATFDLSAVDGTSVQLFAPTGLVGTAVLTAATAGSARSGDSTPDGAACTAWPVARVVPEVEPLTPWTVALAAGRAEAIPLDSVAVLSSSDSARLVAEVARVASALPQDPASEFAGLPFVVRTVRRFSPEPGVQAFVATVTRRVNQEANQQTEQLLLVAERRLDRPRAGYVPAYVERVSGQEETLELTDALAALRIGGRATLILGRDYGDGTAYAVLQRTGDAKWRVRWSSAYAGC